MTDQAKFKLVADAFSQNFFVYKPDNYHPFSCSRTSFECGSCTLNGTNYDEPGICLGSKVINDTSLASKFFDQYPECLI